MAHTREVVRVSKVKILSNIDRNGKECMCLYNNPNCQLGYNGECDVEYVSVNKYKNLDECFRNEHRDKPKKGCL